MLNRASTAMLPGPYPQSRPVAMGRNGVASTPHLLASEAAIDVMKRGGNAFDAAVAAGAVCAVVQPFSSGLGGLGWATVHDAANNKTEVLEFHGCVPQGTHAGLFRQGTDGLIDWQELEARGKSLLGSLVPGALAGWAELIRAKGTWKLADVLAPAILLARDGFPVSTLLHQTIVESSAKLQPWPASRRLFLPNGKPRAAGEWLVQPELARTLQSIADEGTGVFYDGPIGQSLARFYQANGGTLSERDLADYRPRWHEPLTGRYRGYTLKAAPAPLGDLSFLQGLGIHDQMPPFSHAMDADYVHASLESAKLVRADRKAQLGDVAGSDNFARLLSTDYLKAQAARIGATAASADTERPSPPHTITLAVIDSAGNAVHLMQTVGYPFGAGAVDDETGIIANTSLYFADADPALPNGVAPGKRLEQNPAVMMAFDRDGRLAFVTGTPGGKTRVETVRQMVINIVDFGMNIQQAVDAPRFLSAPDGATAELEEDLARRAPTLAAELERRGHRVDITSRRFGTGQAVMIDAATGTRMAGADWRQESVALAY
jgi:gamma-glutamyltranspeptidase/glutathione hydrolase